MLASHRKLEELYVTKDVTFKKLNELQSGHLKPLMESIEKLEVGARDSDKARIAEAREQLVTTISLLEPLSNVYSTEQMVRDQRVLLAESDRKQQVISKLALGGSGVRLDVVSTVEEVLQRIQSGSRYDLVFISSQLADLIPEIHERLAGTKLVFLASCNVPAELPALRKHADLISNIVSRHPEDRTFTVKNIGTTVTKLVSKDIFGMEKYLIWGVEIHRRPVVKSDVRRALIDEMLEQFGKLGIRNSILDRVATVTEELLMNAIYDAPTTPDGTALYNHLPRTTPVELKKTEQAELRYACDGMLAAVSVSDPFGGFRMQTLLNYLERNYSMASAGNVDIQEKGKGGAGRGLHLIIASSDLVVFNVHRGKRTEVIALFNLDPKTLVEDAKPSFHFFAQG